MSKNLAGEMLVGRVGFGESFQACSASYSSTEDAMARSIVRLECEAEELRATVAMLQEQARILASERDEAREDLDEEMKFHHRTHGECVIAQCELMDVKKERDEAREALREIQAAGWKTAGELRGMARKALEAAK